MPLPSLLQFKVNQLTLAMERTPYVPGAIGATGIFKSRGVNRTHVDLEYKENKISLLTTSERGLRNGQVITGPKRKVLTFRIPHIEEISTIRPDDLPDVRSFGTPDGQVMVNTVISDLLSDQRVNIEATWEFHRMGAIHGKLVEPDGSLIYDFFDEFSIIEPTINIHVSGTDPNSVKLGAAELIRYMQDRLGTTPFSSIRVLCGDEFFDSLITKEEVKDAYNRPREGQFLRDNQVRDAFLYAGIIWENYRGKVGTVDFLKPEEARAYPTGVPNLFWQYNGPDDTMSGVGKPGKPIVVTHKYLDHDSGVEIRSQTNPLFLCTLPSTLVKLVDSDAGSSS